MTDLINKFEHDGYTFGIAETPKYKLKSFGLRYEVYAVEFGFEPENPSMIEFDEYDKNSMHVVCVDRDDTVVGTLRLIPDVNGLPIYNECLVDLSPFQEMCAICDCPSIIEISRFAIKKDHRRSHGASTCIVFGLFKTVIGYCLTSGIKYCLLLTDEFVYSSLTNFGIVCTVIGDTVDFRGKRTPYLIDIIESLDNISLSGQTELRNILLGL